MKYQYALDLSNKDIAESPSKETQISTPIVKLRDYSNKDLGFSFQYPVNYSSYLSENDWGIKMGCGCMVQDWYEIEVIKTHLDPQLWWQTNGKNVFNGKLQGTNEKYHPQAFSSSIETIQINNFDAWKVSASPNPSEPPPVKSFQSASHDFVVYLMKNRDTLFVITKYETFDPKQDQEFDLTLSTLKFVNPSLDADMSSWKTYSNSSLDFSIRYPTNWEVLERGKAGIILGPKELIDSEKKLTGPHGPPTQDILSVYVKPPSTFNMEIPQSNEFYSVTARPIILGGINTNKYELTWLQDGPGIQENDKTYQILINHSGKTYDFSLTKTQYLNIFNQIISSAQFL